MSNPLAISSVTAAFAQLLERALLQSGVSGARVRFEAPNPLLKAERPILNLFLFEVRPHPPYQGGDAPFRNRQGQVVRRPVLALSLGYLLTAYGGEADGNGGNQLEAQHVLAHAMSYVHDNAVLTRAHVREAMTAFSAGANPPYQALATSDLDTQVELVKLTQSAQSGEDMTRIWTALNQSYRLSVMYDASVVLIERELPTRTAPPVRSFGVHALPIARPVIAAVAPQTVTVDDGLVIRGRNLKAEVARVRFASGDAEPATTRIGPDEIQVQQLPPGLRAGANPVVVVHDVPMGRPLTPHRGFESNTGVFTLRPVITSDLTGVSVAPEDELTLDVTPAVGRGQRVALLLGGQVIDAPVSDTGDVSTLTFTIPADQPSGEQLIQVRVDGAESALELQTDEADPLYDQFIGPTVVVL